MAHYAILNEDAAVVQVIVGISDNLEAAFSATTGKTCRRTSYNTRGGVHTAGGTPFRKNYAGIGYTYDAARDAFIPPKPYASWILDEDSCLWGAPVAMPTDGGFYAWNEDEQAWEVVE